MVVGVRSYDILQCTITLCAVQHDTRNPLRHKGFRVVALHTLPLSQSDLWYILLVVVKLSISNLTIRVTFK
jgi:hypothetical protein